MFSHVCTAQSQNNRTHYISAKRCEPQTDHSKSSKKARRYDISVVCGLLLGNSPSDKIGQNRAYLDGLFPHVFPGCFPRVNKMLTYN